MLGRRDKNVGKLCEEIKRTCKNTTKDAKELQLTFQTSNHK